MIGDHDLVIVVNEGKVESVWSFEPHLHALVIDIGRNTDHDYTHLRELDEMKLSMHKLEINDQG